MFKSTVAIALVLAVVMSATYKNTNEVLAEIDTNPFGNTMLSMISLNMATKAPMDDVVVVID
jgi:cell division protein FtsX